MSGVDPVSQPDTASSEELQQVTPWDVGNNVDYEKLIKEFGSQPIDEALIARLEAATGVPAHPWLKRGIFFSHRDLGMILSMVEKKEPFYLYTGRGPSSEALHLGHMVPFHFTHWLQQAFKVPLVIQITDDEKFYFKNNLTLDETSRLGFENCKDIIACGFDPLQTFIFRNTDYIGTLYPVVCQINAKITTNKVIGTFGFTPEDHIGKFGFPAIQAAPSFSLSFPHIFKGKPRVPCLIPCAIDQDPYFRLTRELAGPLKWLKPALVHSTFFPALQGPKSKMSASNADSAIYMTDTPADIRRKITDHALSAPGNCDLDVPYQYLTFFLFDDDSLNAIKAAYTSGELSAEGLKERLIEELQSFVGKFQQRRSFVTDDVVSGFMQIREIPLSPPVAVAKPE